MPKSTGYRWTDGKIASGKIGVKIHSELFIFREIPRYTRKQANIAGREIINNIWRRLALHLGESCKFARIQGAGF